MYYNESKNNVVTSRFLNCFRKEIHKMENKSNEENSYVLAIYDIQKKQDFIYKSNKMRQISGASLLIRDCFKEWLFSLKDTEQKFLIFSNDSTAFSQAGFLKHINNDGYWGELIYEGGGNCYVLYKNHAAYREINKRFYRKLLEETYSLHILTSFIKNVNFDNFKSDWDRLEEEHRKRKIRDSQIYPVNALPIVQVDDRNYMPLAELEWIGKEGDFVEKKGTTVKVSYESHKKYEKFRQFRKAGKSDNDKLSGFVSGEKFLDDVVTARGEESLLAVVYIDGNNMGAKLKACIGDGDYETCIANLRAFSDEIQTLYIDKRIEEIEALLQNKKEDKRRFVIYAGDEITFICNARHAYDIACSYLEQLYSEPIDKEEIGRRTSCAGISIFHSHMPFSDAYKIAEECCAFAKKKIQEYGITNASLLDYHYCQGAIGTSLEDIRKHEGNEDISRPWVIVQDIEEGTANTCITKEIVAKMKEQLDKLGRSNIKELMFAAKRSQLSFEMELERIQAHYKNSKEKGILDISLHGMLKKEEQRKLVYDMVMVYDLWFTEEDTEEEKANE